MSDGRTERAKAQREERRAQILATSLQVFATRGYHGTSVTDLVEAAGVARGTFYLYFDSKQAIFLELLDALLEAFRGTVQGIDVAQGSAVMVPQVEATVVRILAAATASRAVATILFREAVGLDAEVDARIAAFEEALHGYIRMSLDNGVRLGWLRPHDTDVAATCVYGSMRQVISRFVIGEEQGWDPEHVAREVVAHHVRGLAAG